MGLRKAEDELGIKDALDEQFGELERMMDLANKPPAEALKALEQMLANNPKMQEELRRLAEQSLQQAKKDLDAAADAQRKLNEEIKQADNAPKPAEAGKPMNQLAQAARDLAQKDIPAAEKAAADAKSGSEPELKRAGEKVQQAIDQAAEPAPADPEKNRQQREAFTAAMEQAAKELRDAAAKAEADRKDSATEPEKKSAEAARDAAQAAAAKATELAQQAGAKQDKPSGAAESKAAAEKAQKLGEKAAAMAKENLPQIGEDSKQAGAKNEQSIDNARKALEQAAKLGEQAAKGGEKAQEQLAAMAEPLKEASQQLAQAAKDAMDTAKNAPDAEKKNAALAANAAAEKASKQAEQLSEQAKGGGEKKDPALEQAAAQQAAREMGEKAQQLAREEIPDLVKKAEQAKADVKAELGHGHSVWLRYWV